MSSKIVIIGVGCASSMRARPAALSGVQTIHESDFAP